MKRPILILLEGANDLEFLVRIASRLQSDLPNVPDLGHLQLTGRIIMVPLGRGDPASWPDRLRPLDLPEFHLYDREQLPETDVRRSCKSLVELEKLFIVVEHDLPSREQLQAIAQGVATEAGELPSGQDLERVLDSAAGLTRYEAENAFSLSLVRHGKIEPEPLWQMKSQMLKKGALVQLHRGSDNFSHLGGLPRGRRPHQLPASSGLVRRPLRRIALGLPQAGRRRGRDRRGSPIPRGPRAAQPGRRLSTFRLAL